MNIKLQQIKDKTKLEFYKNINKYYDNMNIRFDEGPFAKNAQGINKIYHDVLKWMNFLQTKPEVKNMIIIYYDLYYNVIKIRKEKEFLDDKYENDFISLKDVFMPNHYVGIKGREK